MAARGSHGRPEGFRNRALVHRCQWHKRENVVSSGQARAGGVAQRLQRAYTVRTTTRPSVRETLLGELDERNQSAAGIGRPWTITLTLHRPGVYGVLGRSLDDELSGVCQLVAARSSITGRPRANATAGWRPLLDIEPRLRDPSAI